MVLCTVVLACRPSCVGGCLKQNKEEVRQQRMLQRVTRRHLLQKGFGAGTSFENNTSHGVQASAQHPIGRHVLHKGGHCVLFLNSPGSVFCGNDTNRCFLQDGAQE